jgi:pimeloyl-ACP methyl ester carboxylesterase
MRTREKIYLIPGTMCNEQLWSVFLPLLTNSVADDYEFEHVKIPKNKDFAQITAHLADFFKEGRVNIIGFSLGGYIAAHFATTHPQQVDKAFIISNSPCALYPAEEKQRKDIIEFVNHYGYKGMSKARAAKLLDLKNGDKATLKQFINLIINMDAELGELEFKSQMRSTSKRKDLFDKLTCASTKFTFYFSDGDVLVNSSWLNKLEQASINCIFKHSEGSSHMLPLEKPNELVGHIHDWLNSH